VRSAIAQNTRVVRRGLCRPTLLDPNLSFVRDTLVHRSVSPPRSSEPGMQIARLRLPKVAGDQMASIMRKKLAYLQSGCCGI